MSGVVDWMARAGIDADAVKRRAFGGVVLGLTVVLIDRVMGFGS